MEGRAPERSGGFRAKSVFHVSQKRQAFRGGLGPDLVGAPRFKSEFGQCEEKSQPLGSSLGTDRKRRRFRARELSSAFERMGPDRIGSLIFDEQVFPAAGFVQLAHEPGEIGAFEGAFLQGLGEALRRLRAFGENHGSGSISIEAVDEAHVISAEMASRPIDQIGISGHFPLAQETGGLVDDNQMGVFE
jgi:hypothetical protein